MIDSLGDIPMLMLTAGSHVREAPPGDASAARVQMLWRELHRDLMRQSSNAQQILVETSDWIDVMRFSEIEFPA